jgi:hypothetical protein
VLGTFRFVVVGAAGFRDYPALRDALDHLLRDRLPEVTILTRSGAGLGTDSLALSYALARRLDVVQHRADHQTHPLLFDADQVRNAELVRNADAAVLVWGEFDGVLRDLLVRCKAKGIPVRVLGAGSPSPPPERPTRRGLLDRGNEGAGPGSARVRAAGPWAREVESAAHGGPALASGLSAVSPRALDAGTRGGRSTSPGSASSAEPPAPPAAAPPRTCDSHAGGAGSPAARWGYFAAIARLPFIRACLSTPSART